MELYYNPLSSYSQKAMIAFYEKGIAFEPKLVNLMDPAGRAAYEAIYPIGKVPFFKPSADYSVPESTSIIEYLEDNFPHTTRLIPEGKDAARQVRFMDRMSDLYLDDPVVTLLFMKFGFRPQDDAAEARARQLVTLTYQHLDARLAKQSWICGEDFSMADCAAIPPLFYAREVMPFDAHPNLLRYWQRAQQRPSYKKVMAEFVPIWEGMKAQRAAA